MWWLPAASDATPVAGVVSYEEHQRAVVTIIGSLDPDEALYRISADPALVSPEVLQEISDLASNAAEDASHGTEESSSSGLTQTATARRVSEIPVLHGVINARLISLLRLRTTHTSGDIPGPACASYSFDVAVLGGHVAAYEEPYYVRCDLRFDQLDTWCGRVLLDAPQKVLRCSLDDGTVMELWLSRGGSIGMLKQTETKAHVISLKFPGERALSDIVRSFVPPWQNLLTTCVGVPCCLTGVTVQSPSVTWGGGQTPLEVVFADRLPRTSAEGQRNPYLLPLGLGDVVYEDFLPQWIATHDKYEVATQFAYAPTYSSAEHPEMRLMSAATAMEAFRSVKLPLRRTPFLDKSPAVDLILSEFPEAEHPLLRERLKHFNDPSFRERLTDLASNAGELFQPIAGERLEAWVSLVVKTRNKIAHGSKGRPSGAAQLAMAEALQFLVEMSLLLEAGVSLDALLGKASADPRYRWLIELRQLYLDQLMAKS
jgi:hypothetical protein